MGRLYVTMSPRRGGGLRRIFSDLPRPDPLQRLLVATTRQVPSEMSMSRRMTAPSRLKNAADHLVIRRCCVRREVTTRMVVVSSAGHEVCRVTRLVQPIESDVAIA